MVSVNVASVLLLGLGWLDLMFCENQNIATTNNGLNEPDFPTPEYVLPCSRNDPKIDACFNRAFNHLQPYLVKGITELNLPPIEPLVIPELKMENGEGPVRIRAYFTNITVIGAGDYTLTKVRINVPSYRIDLHLSIPKIELQGNYDINGNVLLFPIQSQGNFWALFGDVDATVRMQGVETVINGVRYLMISRLLIDFSLGRARFRVMDHLNGNNVIGQAMNQFLNQNAKDIIEEMRPAASVSIAKYFKTFMNTAFTKIPLKVWLLDA